MWSEIWGVMWNVMWGEMWGEMWGVMWNVMWVGYEYQGHRTSFYLVLYLLINWTKLRKYTTKTIWKTQYLPSLYLLYKIPSHKHTLMLKLITWFVRTNEKAASGPHAVVWI